MRNRWRSTKATILGLLAMLALIGGGATFIPFDVSYATAQPAPARSAADALAQVTTDDGRLRFEVAEDMTRFVFDASVTHEDGLPKHGSAFITQGYIYPAGTLTESNGVLPDGSPEFPDKVLGEWTCRGYFVGQGAHATTGPIVITTQLYNFGSDPGDATLISEGYELADAGVAIERAVTGGTGPFALARGAGEQVFLGFNATEGFNLAVEYTLAEPNLRRLITLPAGV